MQFTAYFINSKVLKKEKSVEKENVFDKIIFIEGCDLALDLQDL